MTLRLGQFVSFSFRMCTFGVGIGPYNGLDLEVLLLVSTTTLGVQNP